MGNKKRSKATAKPKQPKSAKRAKRAKPSKANGASAARSKAQAGTNGASDGAQVAEALNDGAAEVLAATLGPGGMKAGRAAGDAMDPDLLVATFAMQIPAQWREDDRAWAFLDALENGEASLLLAWWAGQFAVGYAAAVGMLRQGDKPIVTPETLAAWLGESDDAPAPPPPPVNITREVLDAWLGIASGAEQSTPHPAGEG